MAYENKGAMAATIVVAASNSLNVGAANYVCSGAADNVQIQAAIDALPAIGGVIHLLEGDYALAASVTLKSNVALTGTGFGTHLTADGNYRAIIIPNTNSRNTVKDMKISGEGSGTSQTSNHGIHIQGAKFVVVENILFGNPSFGQHCLYISAWSGVRPTDIVVKGLLADTTTGVGKHHVCYSNFIRIDGADRVSINNCVIKGSEDPSITLQTGGDASTEISIVGNVFSEGQVLATIAGILNSANKVVISGNIIHSLHNIDGVQVKGQDWNVSNNIIVGNVSSQAGIYLDRCDNCIISNNRIRNHAIGIETNGATNENLISGNRITNCTTGINLAASADKNLVIGNHIKDSITTPLVDAGSLNQIEDDNVGIEITDIKMYRNIKNTSGGALAIGDVVMLKAVAAGNEVTTPAATGEDQVYGMVAEVIANNTSGLVQVKGKTTVLKATNAGGGNILIGDTLGTEAGVRARKTAAGDQCFAKALEACAAADCTLDAYIKSPWD